MKTHWSPLRRFLRHFGDQFVNFCYFLRNFIRHQGTLTHILGDFLQAARCLGHIVGDLPGHESLLIHRHRNAVNHSAHGADFVRDFLDLADSFDRNRLDRLDIALDLIGGPGGLLGKFLDLVGNDREASAGVPGPCRFDGRVQASRLV